MKAKIKVARCEHCNEPYRANGRLRQKHVGCEIAFGNAFAENPICRWWNMLLTK